MKFISKNNMKIDEIARSAEYQMDEKFQNLLIFGILIILQFKRKF